MTSDPFEFLRNEAQREQIESYAKTLASMAKTYKDALIAAGFSHSAAEQMAVDWHRLALTQALGLKP